MNQTTPPTAASMPEGHLNALLTAVESKTVIITGGANGIGAATAKLFHAHGANVVAADLESSRGAAEALIESLGQPSRASFLPASVVDWAQMTAVFKETLRQFGRIDIVVANAGIMETQPVLDMEDLNADGELRESLEASRVIDVNLKGTLNTLRLAMFYMKESPPDSPRSIVLLASTSGYFGGTGVSAYIASKHGVVGLLRASQSAAKRYGIRVNGVAPFFTPTHITAGFAESWKAAGLEANTVDGVARVIARAAMDPTNEGVCLLTAGKHVRDLESTRMQLLPSWLGSDTAEFMGRAMRFFTEIGGYVLPKARTG
ncbi:hypothetical protein ASPZODRAFT_263639 [Penicilliopsis zonata CBS 506.65]|uniref:Ketoreductase domain-containing protein n=1 Tax=Penicilliopsis zonata CBS 506.65 TaxID=1073090 RepID=A0A1L9SUR0_9EURO|nr:hypothetical protein ASPZODRAFT_263639 [Penicilliopsis zonata CBS 506.65]OJJ50793.1 hypothetical protein ASPZODRAFT_263639 [Penicilliopsis zonata CBS 506.65]